MYLALTYDHRLLDGREAVTFLVKVCPLYHIVSGRTWAHADQIRSRNISRILGGCCWVKSVELVVLSSRSIGMFFVGLFRIPFVEYLLKQNKQTYLCGSSGDSIPCAIISTKLNFGLRLYIANTWWVNIAHLAR